MIDYFALALSHGLLAFAAWRLLQRADLDSETPDQPDEPPPPDAAAQPRYKLQVRRRA